VKVLMFSWEFPPHSVGGLGKHVTELIPALARGGAEVHLITPRRNGGAAREEFDYSTPDRPAALTTVHRVDAVVGEVANFYDGAVRTNLALERAAIDVWEQAGPFNVVHVHDWLVSFAAIGIKHRYRVPLLATIHATEYGRGRGHLAGAMPLAINEAEWRLTYEAWRVICCSHYMAAEVQTALRAPPDKVDVIPNGVDTARFDALDGVPLDAFRARFASKDEAIVFYVGRVQYEKGVHLLVQAMPRLLATRPGLKLVVAGTGDSANAVRQLAHETGVGANCYFTGFIPDADRDRLFRVADVAAFPSLYEPFGIVALEAMAARTPVVASSVGGLAEVLRHGENAITVYPNSVDSLAWGILQTIDRPDLARRRAEVAYTMVVEHYNWEIIARQTRSVYDRLVAERRAVTWV
jgi:glycosyltransferase involved in cell wall biosynthesis